LYGYETWSVSIRIVFGENSFVPLKLLLLGFNEDKEENYINLFSFGSVACIRFTRYICCWFVTACQSMKTLRLYLDRGAFAAVWETLSIRMAPTSRALVSRTAQEFMALRRVAACNTSHHIISHHAARNSETRASILGNKYEYWRYLFLVVCRSAGTVSINMPKQGGAVGSGTALQTGRSRVGITIE
jgi:hypothetical protein